MTGMWKATKLVNDMMHKLEYIWLDGYTPEPNIRSKTKIYTTGVGETPNLEF